jgi:hypothetical protein
MNMGTQHGHGDAAWTLACSMEMGIQHGPGRISMGMGMQHGYGNAAWTWTCTMEMKMLLGGHRSIIVLLTAFHNTYTFTVLPVSRPPMLGALTFSSKLISSNI